MTRRKILQYPDLRLKRKAKQVEDFGEQTQAVIDDMFETHYNTDNCAALAATQLDFEDPLHITVIDFSPQKNQPLCLVNAKIIDRRDETNTEEGCMSVGGAYEKVRRAKGITVKGFDRHGKPVEFEADGFMAKCIQHELDHLDGKIFLDHLSSLKRRRADKKVEKYWRVKKDDE